ncbi:unnamed protein product, partial [Nesidiocoris tenuis]
MLVLLSGRHPAYMIHTIDATEPERSALFPTLSFKAAGHARDSFVIGRKAKPGTAVSNCHTAIHSRKINILLCMHVKQGAITKCIQTLKTIEANILKIDRQTDELFWVQVFVRAAFFILYVLWFGFRRPFLPCKQTTLARFGAALFGPGNGQGTRFFLEYISHLQEGDAFWYSSDGVELSVLFPVFFPRSCSVLSPGTPYGPIPAQSDRKAFGNSGFASILSSPWWSSRKCSPSLARERAQLVNAKRKTSSSATEATATRPTTHLTTAGASATPTPTTTDSLIKTDLIHCRK